MLSSVGCGSFLVVRTAIGLRHSVGQNPSFKTNQILRTIKNSAYLGKDAFNYNPKNKRSTLYYLAAAGVFAGGMSYAAVPLYRIFCQAYSFGGAVQEGSTESVEHLNKVRNRELTIKFNADVASSMRWNFKPQQYEIKVIPGETALAFYTARNPSEVPVIGISTYNVVPFEAGQYFNKIQCFCFEEQILNPHEEVDMPVFFYIDPEFAEDPKMEFVNDITLSYTFFEAKPGLNLPYPGFAIPHAAVQKTSQQILA